MRWLLVSFSSLFLFTPFELERGQFGDDSGISSAQRSHFPYCPVYSLSFLLASPITPSDDLTKAVFGMTLWPLSRPPFPTHWFDRPEAWLLART
jgi:hypothetical protein